MKILIVEDQQIQYDNIKEAILRIAETKNYEQISENKIYPFLVGQEDAINIKPEDFDLIFIDLDLWGDEYGGISFAEIYRKRNPQAYTVLISYWTEKALNEKGYDNFFNDYVQKANILRLERTFKLYKTFIEEKEKQKILGNFTQGPKNGKFAKDEQYKLFYLEFINQPESLKSVEAKTTKWYRELEKFIQDPNYEVPATILYEWKANEDPFSKKAIKNNTGKQLLQNILAWRRMIIRLYESGRKKGLPTFVERSDLVKVEDARTQTKVKKTETITKYNLKCDADYNFVCLKSIDVLYSIHRFGKYTNERINDKRINDENENQIKGFISTYLSFSYKKPYIQFDYQEFTDLFKEEEEYFKNLDLDKSQNYV